MMLICELPSASSFSLSTNMRAKRVPSSAISPT